MADAAIDHVAIPRFELGSWNWTFNATQYVPSAKDLALAGPRMFMKLGSFIAVPEAIDNIFGGVTLGNRIIPEATGAGIVEAVTTAAAGGSGTRETIRAGTQILVDVNPPADGITSRFTMEGVRSLGNVFSYATSKWALGCIIVAVVLNRTYVYASTRRNLTLPWKVRWSLRIVPIILLVLQCQSLLQSIQCQTSPDFGLLRWGNATKHSDLMFTQDGGFLHDLSSTLLFGASDEASCLAVRMIAPEYDEEIAKESPDGEMPPVELQGSLSLLWPAFKTLCFSQFVETISCAVQGRQVATETGMSLFEHSLAFAEAEGQISHQLGFGTFGSTKNAWASSNSSVDATKIAITRSMIMKKVNTTPEVLLVGLISSLNHLTSHILALFNKQGQFRLLNTGIWGLAFMSAIVWSIWSFSIEDMENQSLLRFPTVCIVGFIPHVLVFFGIVGCAIIYSAALVLSAVVPPPVEYVANPDEQANGPHFRSRFLQRLWTAHRNMQANVPLSNIRITQHMDFYTALLRTGFAVMTMASEAVYLNESRGVSIKHRTWLEEERIQEIESIGAQWLGPTFKLNDPDSNLADGYNGHVGLVPVEQTSRVPKLSLSGYSREMTAKKTSKSANGRDRPGAGINGVGAAERSGRWIMALEFFIGINRLLLSWWASLTLKLLAAAGFQGRPRILLWLVRVPKERPTDAPEAAGQEPQGSEFLVMNDEGEMARPKDDRVDVEAETRQRMRSFQNSWDERDEKQLDSNLYKWWLGGGWWGAEDNSGNYTVDEKELDDDTTSVVSFSTTGDDQEWESGSENDDGRRTPTQSSPQFSREGTPFLDTTLDVAGLTELLYPKTPEQRAEAQALAVHLANDRIVTRSQYRKHLQHERAQVLTSSRHRPENFSPSSPTGKLTPEEEAQILEHLIISRRQFQAATGSSSTKATLWDKGASGMGEGGPQCVVCQCSPRSIIVWPCRCLSLCDDCRVTLAMNNFDKCVCCRRDVASFSRIFVP